MKSNKIKDALRNSVPGRIMRGLLRPRWFISMKSRVKLKRANPTSTFHRKAIVDGFVKLGRHVFLDSDVWIYESHIGNYSYVADGARVAHAEVGNFCSIGPRAYVGLPQHPTEGFISSHPLFYQHIPWRGFNFADRDYFEGFVTTKIGNDVWIGANAMIKGGIIIGDGAIIGAGAVVVRDVPPYSVCVGVPAKIIRYRFDSETIKFMLEFGWWYRDEEWLRQNWKLFHKSDEFVREFLKILA